MNASETAVAAVPRARSNPFLCAWRLFVIAFWTIRWALPLFFRSRGEEASSRRVAQHIASSWAKRLLRSGGLAMTTEGTPTPGGCLIVPNHVSYLDILVILASTGGFFVGKSEIGSWPIIGRLMRSSENIFVERKKKSDIIRVNESLERVIRLGFPTVVFLEGTSSGGSGLLPLKPNMAQPAIVTRCPVVPVSLLYRIDTPGTSVEEDIAYWRDMTLLPHLLRLLGLRGHRVHVVIGEPILPQEGEDRAELTKRIEAALAAPFARRAQNAS